MVALMEREMLSRLFTTGVQGTFRNCKALKGL